VRGETKGGKEIDSITNIDEFLGVGKGKFIADGGHDRLLARVEICITT
jgi:hypothetical protein